jgi:transposase
MEVGTMVIGIDSHKETVAACAVDELGGELAAAIFPNTGAGHDSLLSWARSHGKVSLFGIEGSGGVGYALACHLATLREDVVEVPPFLTVRERKHLRQRGKSDPADALAIARVVVREADLPRFLIHDRARQLGQILNYRDQLVEERTRGANRLHSELTTRRHPGYQAEIRNLVTRRSLRRAQALVEAEPSIEAALLIRRMTSLRRLSSEIADLNVHIRCLVEQSRTGLIEIIGVGPLVAARILADVGDVRRIASESRFAALNGTAPVPASSGTIQRHRLNRGGNRRLNRALHTIAVIQAHLEPRAGAYLQRRRAEGKTQREAIRCLKRQLSNVVYRQLVADSDRTH